MPALRKSAGELLAEDRHFQRVPADWHVVITDVKGSTQLVAAGRHEAINLIATGSIIAALNIAHGRGIEIPFFFGGDGATLLVPQSLLDPVMQALARHRDNTRRNFSIELRVGSVAVATILAERHTIRLAKLLRTDAFAVPVVLGQGFDFAERLIKGEETDASPQANPLGKLDLTGMECRWDRIAPPAKRDEIVCLLVNAASSRSPAPIFQRVLEQIENIYGPREQRNPISAQGLRLDSAVKTLKQEMRAKLGRFDWRYLLEHWVRTAIIGPGFLRYAEAGRTYVSTVPELADTLVIDGRINTVISGTAKQRQALTTALDLMESRGDIFFGLHVCSASIMSCYVRNREDEHIHFVDGADGGYTHAAVILKAKLRAPRPR